MALMLVLLCMAVAAAAGADSNATTTPEGQALDPNSTAREFEQFCQDFGKEYAPEERAARMANFEDNLRFIRAENAKGHPFELGLNRHADLSHAEFLATRLGLQKSNGTKPSDGLPHGAAVAGGLPLGAAVAGGVAPPASVDWRRRGVLPAVRDQGRCGSCWTFSAAEAISAAWAVRTDHRVALSEQQLLDCAGGDGDGCRGGYIEAAFGYATGAGLCTAASYPYQAHQSACRAGGCSVAIPLGGVRGYRHVRPGDQRALMEAVAQQPVSLGIEAEGRAFHFYSAGVFAQSCGVEANHAVLLVGYGVQGSTPFWLLQNSWGPSWGDEGFFKLLRTSSGPGECGVMTMPSYPVVRGERQQPTSPPPATTSPPSGRQDLYDRPPCQPGEAVGHVLGGTVCTPPCDFWGRCPRVTIPGVAARPRCVLRDARGERHCALVCRSSLACAPGARCLAGSSGQGVCVFPDGVYASAVAAARQIAKLLSVEDPRRLAATDAEARGNFV